MLSDSQSTTGMSVLQTKLDMEYFTTSLKMSASERHCTKSLNLFTRITVAGPVPPDFDFHLDIAVRTKRQMGVLNDFQFKIELKHLICLMTIGIPQREVNP